MANETLYECGVWKATPGEDEFYSPGEVFIEAKNNKPVPKFLGELEKRKKPILVPEGKNLAELIRIVSQEMVRALGCKMVYLVSLNESKSGLHFRLFPRYKNDEGILNELDAETNEENDGLALMARWRRQFLLKKSKNCSEYIELYRAHRDAIDKLRDALNKRAKM